MSRAWSRLGLRGRLALSIGAIFLAAFAIVYVAVRGEMGDEAAVIKREEGREPGRSQTTPAESGEAGGDSRLSPISDAQSEVERTFILVGGATLLAALLAGYLLAARTAAPLRRMAATAGEVDAGDLTPRLEPEPSAAVEVRIVVDAFNHMLDRLDQAFSRQHRFVSDASHELRTPLTAIRGQLEVLAREPSPSAADVRRVEGLAMTEMRRIEKIVDQLLTLARLDEAGEPDMADIEVAPFLRTVADASSEPVRIGELPDAAIRADADLLTQVIRNLLSNARRHAGPTGSVELAATVAGDRLLVTVDDDGPGVPSEQRELVFDRFQRAQASRDRATGGSGLGLGIARSIVELHRGRIWIEDSPLGGARAAFELPGAHAAR